ncbi:MAG: chalcone isomerase family protein [Cryobacterium sp.]|nr:chalcone isomerase family protein [Oligoflexia bacterium]
MKKIRPIWKEFSAHRIGLAWFIAATLLSVPGQVTHAEEARFSSTAEIAGKALVRQGVGTRKATLFAIRVYDAAFYGMTPAKDLAEVLAMPNPKRFDIRYARDFKLDQTREAWTYQFRESSGMKMEDLKSQIDLLLSFQKPIKENDVQRFDLKDGITEFFINGEKLGEIRGAVFQKALLTVFFGPNPPTKDLQKGLYNQ